MWYHSSIVQKDRNVAWKLLLVLEKFTIYQTIPGLNKSQILRAIIHSKSLPYDNFKGEVSPNNNVDWVRRKQF